MYRGGVFRPGEVGAASVFNYERRVASTANGLAVSHITFDIHGEVIIEEAAQVSPAYTLRRFDMANRQTGASGSVVVSGDDHHLTYTLRQGDALHTADETIDAPAVTGPSLHGFVLRQWDTLAAGKTVPVRLVVLAKLRSYGFDIRQAGRDTQHTRFSITPSNWLVRSVVAPLVVTFDTTTRHVVRYEGRVPPMLQYGDKLQEFDARVEYSHHAPVYR